MHSDGWPSVPRSGGQAARRHKRFRRRKDVTCIPSRKAQEDGRGCADRRGAAKEKKAAKRIVVQTSLKRGQRFAARCAPPEQYRDAQNQQPKKRRHKTESRGPGPNSGRGQRN